MRARGVGSGVEQLLGRFAPRPPAPASTAERGDDRQRRSSAISPANTASTPRDVEQAHPGDAHAVRAHARDHTLQRRCEAPSSDAGSASAKHDDAVRRPRDGRRGTEATPGCAPTANAVR